MSEIQSSRTSTSEAQTIAILKANAWRVRRCNCSCHTMQPSLLIYPQFAIFEQRGGASRHTLTNRSQQRIAIKVKCSDNRLYKVNPVYSFLDPGASEQLDVARGGGFKKKDKLILMFVLTNANETDAKCVFDSNIDKPNQLIVPLCVRE
uniref:Major sperm protein n=1 Tax=Ascaris lumbricoides TaxID=6252 RepID=A0A0M3IH99_ASCLU